jgi:hypothetical protein
MFTLIDKDGNIETTESEEIAKTSARENAECDFNGDSRLTEYECCIIDWDGRVSTILVFEIERKQEIVCTAY